MTPRRADPLAPVNRRCDGAPGELDVEPPFSLPLDEFIEWAKEQGSAALVGDRQNGVLLPEHGYLFMSGAPGVGKTTLAVDGAFHLSSAIPWLGFQVARPLNVLFIENEGPPSAFGSKIERKRNAWEGELRGRLQVARYDWGHIRVDDPEALGLLVRDIEQHEIDLVIADTARSFGATGAGGPDDGQRFLDRLRALGVWRSVAVWLLHHNVHGISRGSRPTSDMDAISGAWARDADSVLVARADGTERIVIAVAKLREGEERTIVLAKRRDVLGFEVLATDVPDLRKRILERLVGDRWLTVDEIAVSNEGGIGVRKADVVNELRRLVAEELVDYKKGPPGRKHNARCYRLRLGAPEGGATRDNQESTSLPGCPPPPLKGRDRQRDDQQDVERDYLPPIVEDGGW